MSQTKIVNPKTGAQLKKEHAKFIKKVIEYLTTESKLSIFDAQIASQVAEMSSRLTSSVGMVKILESALYLANLYRIECKGDADTFFSTDMAILGNKLTEALNKMKVEDIRFEEV